MNDNNLKVKGVSKSFKGETVLENVSFTCVGGHIYGVIGRNGSGKSVLFKIICGLLSADSGSVIVNGKCIGKDIDFPEKLGAIIENPGFIWYESGLKNLLYLASIRNIIDRSKVKDVMRLVGLSPENKKWVAKYSLGMKQRLSIAQAIMEDPDIIILDEPMNGLDEAGVEDMRRIFLDLKNEGKIILLASHNKEDIELLCDVVYTIQNGRLEEKQKIETMEK